MNEIAKEQAAYIAGFFDGEGSISSSQTQRRKVNKGKRLAVSIGQKNLQVLQYIHQILGMGHLYKRSRNGSPSYTYRIGNRRDILDFIKLVQPYCVVKKEKLKIGKKLALTIQENSTKKISSKLYSLRRKLGEQLRNTPNG